MTSTMTQGEAKLDMNSDSMFFVIAVGKDRDAPEQLPRRHEALAWHVA